VEDAAILAATRGLCLEGHLNGNSPAPSTETDGKVGDKTTKVPNLAYDEWYSKDQQVLSFVLGSLGREVLSQVISKVIAVDAWTAIENMFLSQTRARAVNTRLTLATA
jgi:hypothetical protein